MNDFLKQLPTELAEKINDPAAPREAWTPQVAFELVAAGMKMAHRMAIEATDLWDGDDPKSCPLFIRSCLLHTYPVLLELADSAGLDVPDWAEDYRDLGNPFSAGVMIGGAELDRHGLAVEEIKELLEIQRAQDEETDNE